METRGEATVDGRPLPPPASHDDTADDIDEELVYMALLFDQGELGIAVYDSINARLRTLQIPINSQRELIEAIERVHLQFGIHRVILSTRNATVHGLLQLLKTVHSKLQRNAAVTLRKHQEFNYLRACQAIEKVRVGGTWWDSDALSHEMTRREIYKFLGSYFDFESKTLIRAAGAMIEYLASEKIGNQLETTSTVCLSAVERVTLEGMMHIDIGSFQSLQIFSRESHPSLVKGAGRAKEGFSLFGLLNRTVTKAGSALLRQWMLTPLVRASAINERLDAVGFFFAADNADLLKTIRAKLKCFGDVSRIFTKVRGRCATPAEWSKFNDSISGFLAAQSLLQNVSSEKEGTELPALISIAAKERSTIHVSNLLGNIIDFDESLREGTVVIRAGVSEVLDTARCKYEDLDNVLTEVAYQIQEAHPSLSTITVQYIPQVGYVICCDAPTTLSDFIFQFQEDDTTFYYKDSSCRDLDVSVGDIFGFILDVQRDLLEELTAAVLQYEHSIFEMISIVALVDCVAALADTARTFNHKRPIISERNEFVVRQARHPLQELIVDRFIPNDARLDSDTMIMLITGQNGSGKSVYLKMVGLLQFMSQIGAFVPAEDALVGPVGKILTRIQSMETATISQSSFTIDCNQISWMLKERHCRALFLIDEFGKGTAEADGTALLASAIKHFTRQGTHCNQPRVVVTTHLLDVFRKNLLSDSPRISTPNQSSSPTVYSVNANGVTCAMMASTEAPIGSNDPVRMFIPLHELREGVTFSSNALGCAVTCGIPSRIVKRASEILESRKNGQPIMPCLRSTSQSWEEQLLTHFVSVNDWTSPPGDALATLKAIVRMKRVAGRKTSVDDLS